jgi:type VI secretion system protein ImpK
MIDAFTEVVAPVIQGVIDFQDGLLRGKHPTVEEQKRKLVDLLNGSEDRAGRASPQVGRDFELAKRALVYWIDEILITSSWSHAQEWTNHILEFSLYRESAAAVRFYEKAIEAEKRDSTDPLEVFFLCVALGFRGDLASNEEEIRRWASRVHERITEGTQHPEQYLPEPQGRQLESELRPLQGGRLLFVVSLLVAATAVVTLAGFIAAVHWR